MDQALVEVETKEVELNFQARSLDARRFTKGGQCRTEVMQILSRGCKVVYSAARKLVAQTSQETTPGLEVGSKFA